MMVTLLYSMVCHFLKCSNIYVFHFVDQIIRIIFSKMASLAERDATEGAPSEAQNPAESSAMSDTSASASVEDRLKDAAEWKDKGNQLYLSKDYLGALEMYDTALKGTFHLRKLWDKCVCNLMLTF